MSKDLVIFYQHAANALCGIGALAGLGAARFWWKTTQGTEQQKRYALNEEVPMWTSAALGFTSLGYLIGRLSGAL